jgi:hypothetical protein
MKRATSAPPLGIASTWAIRSICGGAPVMTVSPVMVILWPSTTQELAPISLITPTTKTGSAGSSTSMRVAVQGPPETRRAVTVAALPTAGTPMICVEPSTITQRSPINHWPPPIA